VSPRRAGARLKKARAERRRHFVYDLLERSGATFLEGFLGVVTLDGLTRHIDLSIQQQLAAGAITGVYAVVKCLAATLRGAADSASLLNADVDPPAAEGP
jgi:hypothetical protein